VKRESRKRDTGLTQGYNPVFNIIPKEESPSSLQDSPVPKGGELL